jgi:hypothetical protein
LALRDSAILRNGKSEACLVYRMLKYGRDYVKQSMEEYEKKIREQLERSLHRKAAALGFILVPRTPAVPRTEPVSI